MHAFGDLFLAKQKPDTLFVVVREKALCLQLRS